MAEARGGLRDRVRRLMSRLKGSVIQQIPPELEACEVCSRLDCSSGEFTSCETRLAAAEFVRTGNDAALIRLKRAFEEARRSPGTAPRAATTPAPPSKLSK